jgi:arylsulfatase A-like enzyme
MAVDRRSAPATRVLALLLLIACRSDEPSWPPCKGCDVVWITVDTLRYDRVGVYTPGAASLTPAIDALAHRGTTYRTAIAQGPHTLVSVPSYFSGRYLHDTGMTFDLAPRQEYRRMPETVVTLAEVLQGAGYETRGFVANPLIAGPAAAFGIEQGFDSWTASSDPGVTQAGVEALSTHRDKPLFLYLHYLGPHTDNPEREGFEARHGTFDTPLRKKSGATAALYAQIRAGTVLVDENGWAWVRALYDDAVSQTDALVGQVLDATRSRDRPTLVVFTSDHGESLGEVRDKLYIGHYQALYEEDIRVPLVLAGPGIGQDTVVEQGLAELVDVAPTVVGLLGMTMKPEWRWVGTPLLGPGGGPGTTAISTSRMGTGTHGIIRDATTKIHASRAKQAAERYDLVADPGERSPPGTVMMDIDPLGRVLHESWVSSKSVEGAMFAPSQATFEQVEALGYTE